MNRIKWTGAAGDSRFDNPGNWEGGVVPQSAEEIQVVPNPNGYFCFRDDNGQLHGVGEYINETIEFTEEHRKALAEKPTAMAKPVHSTYDVVDVDAKVPPEYITVLVQRCHIDPTKPIEVVFDDGSVEKFYTEGGDATRT